MARRYVRDKLGRFASHGGGGGSFGGGGKVGKSAKNVKARKAYKSASSKVRKANRDLKIADRKSSAAQGALTKAGKASHAARKAGTYNNKKATKYMNAADKALGASLARNAAARKIGGSKSGLTRVTNRLTGKGVAKAKRGAVNPNKLASSKKYATARKARKGSAVRKDAVASAKIKRGERRVRAAAKKNKSEIKMTRRQYSKVHKDFKGSDPKNPRALKFVEGKGTVSMPVKFVKKYNQTDAFTASKAKRGSAATKRDRILRTAKKNVLKSGGIKSAAFDRRVKRLQKAEDIMTKAMGGSTAWKNF
tara:strand:+ start:6664 stop:7584 length:921 start_codon:yes stop_codon:yes gene_type:complete